jgi:class 3 adenylate cyclase
MNNRPQTIQTPTLTGWLARAIWLVPVLDIAVLALFAILIPRGLDPVLFATFALMIASFGLVGAVVTIRLPRNPIGWILWISASFVAIALAGSDYGGYSVEHLGGRLPGTVFIAWLSGWLFVPAIGLTMVFIPLLFPDGHLSSRRWRPVAWFGAAAIAAAALTAFRPGPLSNVEAVSNPFGIRALVPLISAVGFPPSPPLIAAIFIALAATFARYRHGDPVERRQLKWFGAVFLLAVVIFAFAPDQLSFPGIALLPVGIGIAILRYRLYDIDLLINRTLVYGSVTAVLAAAFVVANIALQYVVESLTGQRSELISGVLGGGVALAFGPLRRRIRPIVDRFLPSRAVLTLVFTDIVGSTRAIVELGDERWRELLGRYLAAVRAELGRFGGHEVNTAGDAFFATFDRPIAGVRCAWAIRDAIRQLGLETRTGVHLGEVDMRGEQVSGLAVHTAARVMAAASDGEVLVSGAVRDAIRAPDVDLRDRGRQELKGVPGEWQLYGAEPSAAE